MTEQRLEELLRLLPSVTIAVVGDFFLDQYLILDPSLTEKSIETGLDAYQVVARRTSPGAAGTVTSNLRALGIGRILAVGVIGDDGEGYQLKAGLRAGGVSIDHLLAAPGRFTPTYTKPMFRGSDGREVEGNRIDIKNRTALGSDLERELIERLRDAAAEADGVIIADQVQERNCGVITDAVREEIARLAAACPEKICFADSRVRIGEFRNVLIKPNRTEAIAAAGSERSGRGGDAERGAAKEGTAIAAGRALAARTGRPVYLTMGEEGLLLFHEGEIARIPAVSVTGEVDPVGAGDSCTAGIVSTLCADGTLEEAGWMGCRVASITVRKLGETGTASPEELRESLRVTSPSA